jgi:ribosomal protein L7/L12
MPSQSIPELMEQVDRIERQVALISEHLGIPYSTGRGGPVPDEVLTLARSGDKQAAIAKYRALTGAGLGEAAAAIEDALG